jgi:hypothetical protein
MEEHDMRQSDSHLDSKKHRSLLDLLFASVDQAALRRAGSTAGVIGSRPLGI